jgi:hypothetical protein
MSFADALKEAFARTGAPLKDFFVTKWGKTPEGKTVPVEWQAPGNAEVSLDWGHYAVNKRGEWVTGPDTPHIGWKTPVEGKVGHILMDSIPASRPLVKEAGESISASRPLVNE